MDPYITLISAVAGTFAVIGGLAAFVRWFRPRARTWWRQRDAFANTTTAGNTAPEPGGSSTNAKSAKAKKELGKLHRQRSEFPEAERLFTDAYDDFVQLSDKKGQANALMNRGILFRMINDWSDSERDHLAADRLYQQESDRRSQADNLKNYGVLYRDMGKNRRAIEIHQQSLSIYEDLGLTAKIAELKQELGIDHAQLGETDTARSYLNDTHSESEDVNDP